MRALVLERNVNIDMYISGAKRNNCQIWNLAINAVGYVFHLHISGSLSRLVTFITVFPYCLAGPLWLRQQPY